MRHGGNSYYDHCGNSGGRRPQARTAHIGLSVSSVYKLYVCVWYVCLCMCYVCALHVCCLYVSILYVHCMYVYSVI